MGRAQFSNPQLLRRPCGEIDQLRYLHGALHFDTRPRRDSGETRHSSGTRTRQLQMIGNFCVLEYHVAKPVVAAGVPSLDLRHVELFVFAEILSQERGRFLLNVPRLSLVIANLEAALGSVECEPLAFERHDGVK